MQFKIYFLYHICYNIFQFPRENCNDRYIHHLAKNVKVFSSLHPLLLSTNIELMFAVYLFNLESIYSQSTSQISEEKKVEITYLSIVWNVHWCLIVLVYILILVVNIDQSTSSFICYTSFKKLKFPQIKQTASFISSMITFLSIFRSELLVYKHK